MNENKKQISRIVSLVVGGLALVVILYWGGIEALKKVARGDPLYLTSVFVTTGLITFLGSVRWGGILNSLEGRRVASRPHFYYYHIMSRAVGLFASRNAGDLGARPLGVKMSGSSSFGKALFASVLDKAFDLWLLLLFIIPVLLYSSRSVSLDAYLVSLLVFVAFGSVIVVRNYASLLDLFLSWIGTSGRRVSHLSLLSSLVSEEVLAKIELFRERVEVGNGIATQSQLIAVLKYMLLALRAYCVSMALDLSIPLGAMFVALPIVQASALLSVTPAGLGIQELGWYGALALAGVDNSKVVVFLIGQRAYVLLSILLLAALAHIIVYLVSGRNRDKHQEGSCKQALDEH